MIKKQNKFKVQSHRNHQNTNEHKSRMQKGFTEQVDERKKKTMAGAGIYL